MTDIKKTTEKTEEITRKIWLAGLGAYGQGLDNLQQGYEKMSDQARDFFEELVARGEKLEKETRTGVKNTGKKIREQADRNKELLSEQLADLKGKISGNMTMPSFDKQELLEELQLRVSKLTETLGKLIKPAPAKKPVAKKTTAKPATKSKASASKKAASSNVKKAPAKKPATRKVAAPKTP